MKKIYLVLLISLLIGCSSWSPKDKTLFATYTAFNIIDMAQTNEIFHNENYYELNPILTEDNFIPILLATNVLLYFVVDLLPEKYRTSFLYFMAGTKVGVVGNNYSIGIRF